MSESMWPVFEFRPIEAHARGNILRYADGAWLPDDGEHDISFVVTGLGPPLGLYVDLPSQRNIIWSGLTGSWTAADHDHPRSNPWHYMLRDGETERGGDWGRDRHLNTRAGNAAMSKCCSLERCANGRGPSFKDGDPYILQGLVRDRATKAIVEAPASLDCMYCGDAWLSKAAALARVDAL